MLSGGLATLPLREARELFEREYLLTQINRFGGNISRTASFVGMERSALHRKLKSLGVVTTSKQGRWRPRGLSSEGEDESMKVIICGAGQVGWQIARHLSGENNDVTVVDNNPELVRRATDTLDVQGIAGFASYPDVLDRAGARDADMIIAATYSDEVNMVTCQVAHSVFSRPAQDRAPAGAKLSGSRSIPIFIAAITCRSTWSFRPKRKWPRPLCNGLRPLRPLTPKAFWKGARSCWASRLTRIAPSSTRRCAS